MRPVLLAIACVLVLSPGVAATAQVAGATANIIYDEDGRHEVFESTNATLRDHAIASVVALFERSALYYDGAEYVPIGATLTDRVGLCTDERFGDQPTAAFCSGTLIDDDLVLTAGHCVTPYGDGTLSTCPSTLFVFDYHYRAEDALERIEEDDVYRCRRVVSWSLDGDRDWAVVQLDRPVVGRAAARFASPGNAGLDANGRVELGAPVTELGFPTGLPLKIDTAVATDPGARNDAAFVVSLDAFGGHSGSGIVNAEGELVGVLIAGLEDDYTTLEGELCTRPIRRASRDASNIALYAARARDALCHDVAYPSAGVCGRAPSCGDGYCTAGEAPGCAADCAGSVCGDGVCDADESADPCPFDCRFFVEPYGCDATTASRSGAGPWWIALVSCGLLWFRRRGAVITLATAVLLSATNASAQDIPARGRGAIVALDVGAGGVRARDPSGQFARASQRATTVGVRLGADFTVHDDIALEVTMGLRLSSGIPPVTLSLQAAPRYRLLRVGPRALYTKVSMGAVLSVGAGRGGVELGAALGYRRQLGRVGDLFAEVGFYSQFLRRFPAAYAFDVGYGYHPSAPPSVTTPMVVLTCGFGFGRGLPPQPPPESSVVRVGSARSTSAADGGPLRASEPARASR